MFLVCVLAKTITHGTFNDTKLNLRETFGADAARLLMTRTLNNVTKDCLEVVLNRTAKNDS